MILAGFIFGKWFGSIYALIALTIGATLLYIFTGLDKIIDKKLEPPSIIEMLSSKEIYFPIIGFIILVILGIIINKKYYNN